MCAQCITKSYFFKGLGSTMNAFETSEAETLQCFITHSMDNELDFSTAVEGYEWCEWLAKWDTCWSVIASIVFWKLLISDKWISPTTIMVQSDLIGGSVWDHCQHCLVWAENKEAINSHGYQSVLRLWPNMWKTIMINQPLQDKAWYNLFFHLSCSLQNPA